MANQPIKATDEVNNSLLKNLECPVCFGFCTPPIYMCVNGHNVCNSCTSRITECPICCAAGKPSNRNIFAEEMSRRAKLPCTNAAEGCTAFFNSNEMSPHLVECDKQHSYMCVVELSPKDPGTLCGWAGIRLELIAHVKEKHPAHYSEAECVESKLALGLDKELYHMTLVAAHRQLFWVWLRYNPLQASTYLWSNYVGNKSNAHKYECQFQFKSGDGRSKFNCNLQTLSASEMSFFDSNSPVMELNSNLMKKFMIGDKLTFTAKIFKNE